MCMCKFKLCSMVYRLYYIVYYNRTTSLRLSDTDWDSFAKEATIEKNIKDNIYESQMSREMVALELDFLKLQDRFRLLTQMIV